MVVDGLPLFGGAQLAVDTTLVSEPMVLAEEGCSTRWTGRRSCLWGPNAELTWWSWLSKWAVASHARPRLSSPSWLGPKLAERPS